MGPQDILRQARVERNMTPNHVAAFIGTTLGGYHDLEANESYISEFETLDISEFMRLCLLFDTPPVTLLPEEYKERRGKLEYPSNQWNQTVITATLNARIAETVPDFDQREDELGWEIPAIKDWLKDDCVLGDMPMPALNDLCRFLQTNTIDVLNEYWLAHGLKLPEAE
jgi:transcriptional regulator with XRE-family HTH domain